MTQTWGKMRVRWAVGVLIAGVLTLSPVVAQQLAPRLLPGPVVVAQPNEPISADKDVMLGPDGSFRVAVLTGAGKFIRDARVTMVRQQEPPAAPGTFATGADGQAIVAGMRSGIYQVKVDAGVHGSHQGRLWVWQQNPTMAAAHRPLVVFTVMNQTAAATPGTAVRGQGSAGLLGGTSLRRAAVMGAAALPIAAAALIPLAADGFREEDGHPRPVASP